MPRGVKREVTYTGRAARVQEKVQRLETELREARAELKQAYKEQQKEEHAAQSRKAKEEQQALLRAIKSSGKSVQEILDAINS